MPPSLTNPVAPTSTPGPAPTYNRGPDPDLLKPPYRARPDPLRHTLDAETIASHSHHAHRFDPPPELEPIILQQLASPDCSLTHLAIQHRTTVDALSLWMARPDIAERCRAIITGGMTQARMAIATRLNLCVKGLSVIVACAVESDTGTPAPITFHERRLRELQRSNTIRAVNLILRVGRYDPFAPQRTYRTRQRATRPITLKATTRALKHIPDSFSATLSPPANAPTTNTPTTNAPTNGAHTNGTSTNDARPSPPDPAAPTSPPDPRPPSDPRLIIHPRDWMEHAEMGRQEIADRAATKRPPTPLHSIDAFPDSS